MKFKITHQFFNTEIICTENNFLKWLTHREYAWFVKEHLLTLKSKESVKTDFHTITRIN